MTRSAEGLSRQLASLPSMSALLAGESSLAGRSERRLGARLSGDLRATSVPPAALTSPGYGPIGGQPAVYLYIAALEVNVLNCRGQGLLDRRGAGTPSVVHAALAHGPLAVKLIAGHGAGGERRGPPPGCPRCHRRPWSASGAGPEPGHGLPRTPALDHSAGRTRQAAKPRERHGRAGRLRFSSPRRGRTWLPGASAPYPGITLSDAGGQGARTRTRPVCRANVRQHSPRLAQIWMIGAAADAWS
jgi:hypothetical protein